MNDHRSDEVKAICNWFIDHGCSDTCVLAEPCEPKAFDSKEVYDVRMNKAAEELKNEASKSVQT